MRISAPMLHNHEINNYCILHRFAVAGSASSAAERADTADARRRCTSPDTIILRSIVLEVRYLQRREQRHRQPKYWRHNRTCHKLNPFVCCPDLQVDLSLCLWMFGRRAIAKYIWSFDLANTKACQPLFRRSLSCTIHWVSCLLGSEIPWRRGIKRDTGSVQYDAVRSLHVPNHRHFDAMNHCIFCCVKRRIHQAPHFVEILLQLQGVSVCPLFLRYSAAGSVVIMLASDSASNHHASSSNFQIQFHKLPIFQRVWNIDSLPDQRQRRFYR